MREPNSSKSEERLPETITIHDLPDDSLYRLSIRKDEELTPQEFCLKHTYIAAQKYYFSEKPWRTLEEFTTYWYVSTQKGRGLAPLVKKYPHIPLSIILAKNWSETAGGQTGVGKRGAEFGIMGKGHKGKDAKHYLDPNVEYQAYVNRYDMYDDFYRLLAGMPRKYGKQSKLYINRYKAWKAKGLRDIEAWAYAFQIDVDTYTKAKEGKAAYKKKGKWYNTYEAMSYAQSGCYYYGNTEKQVSCYKKRKAHSEKIINYAKQVESYMDKIDRLMKEDQMTLFNNQLIVFNND